jgi:hypothetical protein
MHLLAAQPGTVSDGSTAVDLGQGPGDIVVLSAADTELACLAAARARLEHAPLARRCPPHPVPATPEPTSPHRGEVRRVAARPGEPAVETVGHAASQPVPHLSPVGRGRPRSGRVRGTDAAASETALAALGAGFPSVRLASLVHLQHNLSVDLYVERVIRHARLVVVRLLGGRGYWPYGVEQVTAAARAAGIALAWLPGDDQPDPELAGLGTLPAEAAHRLWQYGVQGGVDNAEEFLRYAASLIGHAVDWREPVPLLRAGVYAPRIGQAPRTPA